MPRRLIVILLALVLTGGAKPLPKSSPPSKDITILVSIDGFRPEYLTRGLTPTLSRLASEGVSGPMQPSFPSETFPNHYTIVTGLRPDHHGIIANTIEDPEISGETFSPSNPTAMADERWWDGGEPIWVTASKAGLATAAMFWPGSDVGIRGVWPKYFVPFDEGMSGNARVDRLLSWLDLPPNSRPRFATLYFDKVDTAGHRSGPRSADVDKELKSVDGPIARLVSGIRSRNLEGKVTLVIVSDHGMTAISPDRTVRLGPIASSEAANILYYGATAAIDPRSDSDAALAAELLAPRDHMQCWRKGTLPARFVYGTNRRAPEFFCLADIGWRIVPLNEPVESDKGDHGYDNAADDMQAIFIASGAHVAHGRRIQGLRNVDVHDLLGRLLGIPVPEDDGNPGATLMVTAGGA